MSSPWSDHEISLANYPSPLCHIIGQQVAEVQLLLSSIFPVSSVRWLAGGWGVAQ